MHQEYLKAFADKAAYATVRTGHRETARRSLSVGIGKSCP